MSCSIFNDNTGEKISTINFDQTASTSSQFTDQTEKLQSNSQHEESS